ncbi:MAG: hypothetical protein ACF8TS_21445 [Maioricimonas sp. JB049]
MKSHWNWAVAGLVGLGLMGCQDAEVGPDGGAANYGDEAFEDDVYEGEVYDDDEMMDGRQTVTANKIVDQGGVADERVEDELQETRQMFIGTIREGLREVNDEIAQMEAQSEELSEQASQDFNEQIAELKEQREQLNQKLEEAEQAGELEWAEMQSEISDAWTELKASVNEANQELTEQTDEAV